MTTERTFAIIKPDAVKAGHAGKILARIEAAGFAVRAMRLQQVEIPVQFTGVDSVLLQGGDQFVNVVDAFTAADDFADPGQQQVETGNGSF